MNKVIKVIIIVLVLTGALCMLPILSALGIYALAGIIDLIGYVLANFMGILMLYIIYKLLIKVFKK